MDTKAPTNHRIYDGEGDDLIAGLDTADRITVLPDAGDLRSPDTERHIRIMWGQHMLEDLTQDRYSSVVCAVNAHDNSHGIITQLAELLPTSQWHNESVTLYARQFVQPNHVTIVKFDMDVVEVLALLRPSEHEHLTLADLGEGFGMVAQMIARKPQRLPSASVSFLGARANRLVGGDGQEPTFESVLRTMYEAGYTGDVYPATYMWESSPLVFARYPFPASIQRMREGGY